MQAEPNDISFNRSLIPSDLMMIDSIYNLTQMKDKSEYRNDGLMTLLDLDGKATPYFCWRRRNGHSYVAESFMLQDDLFYDYQETIKSDNDPEITGRGHDSIRIHPFNDNIIYNSLLKIGSSKVDLIIDLSDHITKDLLFLLRNGGSILCKNKKVIETYFDRIEKYRDYYIGISKKNEPSDQYEYVEREPFKINKVDNLNNWIRCNA